MASPQKEEGYTPIANELLEQVFQQSLNGTQFRIILVVFRYTYGFSRKNHELSESFISKALNVHKKQVSRELNELITKGIIRVDREATFTTPRVISINKNYVNWQLNDRQVTNKLPPIEKEDGTGSELATSTGSGLAPQDKQILKQNIKQDICDYQQIIDLFHMICVSYSKVIKLSENRKRLIKARLKTYTVDDFKKLFIMAEESKFLKGETESNRSWKANFDWFINETNMIKVLEGNYINKPLQPTQPKQNKFNSHPQRTYTAQDYEAIERAKRNNQATEHYEVGVSMDD
jgi:phage replication O-like protein O